MGKIILYSTGCPKCGVLERKLHEANLEYYLNTSVKTMEELGIKFVPVLSVDGQLMEFSEAIEWLKAQA